MIMETSCKNSKTRRPFQRYNLWKLVHSAVVSKAIRRLIWGRHAKIAISGGIRSGKGKNRAHSYFFCSDMILLIVFEKKRALIVFWLVQWILLPGQDWNHLKDWYGKIQFHLRIRKMSLLCDWIFQDRSTTLEWRELIFDIYETHRMLPPDAYSCMNSRYCA